MTSTTGALRNEANSLPDQSSEVIDGWRQAGRRPLLVAMGPISVPRGGNETRSRLTAEILDKLGMRPAVVTTHEPDVLETPPWAFSLQAPAKAATSYLSPALARMIRTSAASSTCVIITNPMFMPAVAAARVRQPLIWDTNECQTLHYRRLPRTLSNRLKYAVWFGLERWAAHRCAIAVAISETESAAWRSTHPVVADKLMVVDHATLADRRDPGMAREQVVEQLGLEPTGSILVFLGTLRAKQNAAAVEWIISELAPSLPSEVTILLCGPGSEDFNRPGGGAATVRGLGTVEDVDTVVAAADLCLAPLAAGAGVKTKVLHYIAHGRRVAGTPVAFEGLLDIPGVYPAPLYELAGLVNRICRETESEEAATERIRSQEAWLQTHHSRSHVTEQWKKVLACLSPSKPAG
jgi:hypothetical protein